MSESSPLKEYITVLAQALIHMSHHLAVHSQFLFFHLWCRHNAATFPFWQRHPVQFNHLAYWLDCWCGSQTTQEDMPSIRPSISQLWPDNDVWCPARQVHPGYELGTGALGYNFHHWDIPPNCTYLQQPLSQCWDLTKGPDCCCNGNRTAELNLWM